MNEAGLVFIGIDVVAEALDTAEGRRWTRTRAPRGLWRRLGVSTGIVLKHPDAPLQVAVAPADSTLRGSASLRGDSIRISMDADRFAEIVDDCPVVDELIGALLESGVSANAA